MSRLKPRLGAILLALIAGGASAQVLPGIGRAATPKEIAAWDIDVRPDFKGLPKGAGSVAQGQDLWEGKCASCHGIFGESNEVFSPLVGGTTAKDVETGRVARLTDASFPGRTTLMKVPTVSTLWDYINRAMPWNAPKSLKPDEVYAVTAFLLNLGGIVPDNFTLSDRNIGEVQNRMPNRNGMTLEHALWPGKGLTAGKTSSKPDVKAVACMSNCATEAAVSSMLPDHARNAHGNLAEQNRMVGAQHGADTSTPSGGAARPDARTDARLPATPSRATAQSATSSEPDINSLLSKNTCTACHAIDRKLVGPAFKDVAQRYAGKVDAEAALTQRIKAGGVGSWGQIPMPAQAISVQEAQILAQWLAQGARKP